jgi:hypothetical protein
VTPIILVTSGAAGLYALACWALPFRRCSACSGTGTRRTLITRRYTPCRWCRGAGLRLRLGRRAYNLAHTIHHDATTRRRSTQ